MQNTKNNEREIKKRMWKKLEKLYFVFLMFNCFYSDWGNEKLLLVDTSTPMKIIPFIEISMNKYSDFFFSL